MNNWINDFLSRCLEGIPEGSYRARTEKELEDHLLALCRDLEEAGYTLPETRALAAARMGDPSELARRYIREWRRRTLWQRWLTAAELLPVGLGIAAVGELYIANARNFGKPHPAYWGIAAIMAAALVLYAFFAQYRALTRLACLMLAVIQLPPIFCWITFRSTYEFSGILVPWWLGLSIHLLFLAWSVANCKIFARFQEEDSQPAQSA